MAEQKKGVRFIRKNGRIIPIRIDQDSVEKAGLGAAGAAGVVVAADQLNTTRVYQKGNVTIDKKKFALQPFVKDRLGSKMVLRVDGKKAAVANYYRGAFDDDVKSFGFSWLGVKREFRGEGLSKIISKEAARDMRRQGGEYVFNQVVHQNSLKTNLSSRDTLYRLGRGNNFNPVSRRDAMKNINFYRKKKGMLTSDIFRETSIKGIPRFTKHSQPFRTTTNKALIGLGLASAAVSGLGLALRKEDK